METSELVHGVMFGRKKLLLFNEFTDLIAVRKLIHKTIEICFPAYYDEAVVRFFKEYHSIERVREQAASGFTLVYLLDNKIIGTGTLVNDQINAVYIDPAFQNRGLGRRIMFSLLNEAERRNVGKVCIEATPGAKVFYQKLGFEIVSEDIDWVDSISPLYYYKMEKILSN